MGVNGRPPPRPLAKKMAQASINAMQSLVGLRLGAQAAQAEAAAAAAPPPPPHVGFRQGCDAPGCTAGYAASTAILSCARCGEARYCGVPCQRSEWPSHKAYCSKLRAAPRPLRLVQRLLRHATAEGRGLLPPSYLGAGAGTGAEGTSAAAGMGLDKDALNAHALDALLAALPTRPTRLLLLVQHCWAHEGSGSGEVRAPDLTAFEVGADGPADLSGAELIAALESALPYIFREEDRLAEGVRYEPSTGAPKLGHPCPPRIAKVQGARVDPRTSIVTDEGYMASIFGGGGMGGMAVVMGPPRYRWATRGPFECSEMALEDLSIKRIEFFHPRTWPAGWLTLFVEYEA